MIYQFGGMRVKKVVLFSALLMLGSTPLTVLATTKEVTASYSETSEKSTIPSSEGTADSQEGNGESPIDSESVTNESTVSSQSDATSQTSETSPETSQSSEITLESTTESSDKTKETDTEKRTIAELVAANDFAGLEAYLKDPEKYQEVLAEILKTKNYYTPENQVSDLLRAGKNRGVAEFLGVSPDRVLNKLKQHEHDRYYLGTPFKGLWLPVEQNMSPLGKPNKYGPGFNCTGFVATVFNEAGARTSEITKRANDWGGIGNAYNWRNALLPNVEYYTYNSVAALLKGGKAEKGDILYFEPNFAIPGYDPHIGFFWGNTPSHNRMWHSYDANIMSNIKAGRPWTHIRLIKLKATKRESGEGKYIPFGKYVQIKSKNYNIFQNFYWDVRDKSSNKFGKTYLAKGKYQHKNGQVYYSLYDSNDKWIGYMDSRGTRLTEKHGEIITMNNYVTLKQKKYTVWSNFNWLKRYESDEKLGQQFIAKGKYEHYNGATYYSLYDKKGNWHGYVNRTALSVDPDQGRYIPLGKYVQIKSKNYNIFGDFSWHVKSKSADIFEKTYVVKGKYEHKNGQVYYSLYDSKDNWIGYIDSRGTRLTEKQGEVVTMNKYVTLKKKGYTVWSDFDWLKRYESDEKVGQQFIAKAKYTHFNGATYYSLYDNEGNWHGYVNQAAVTLDPDQGRYITFGKTIRIKSPNYNIFNDFKWNVKGSSASIFGKTYLAKGQYVHLNGPVYYSLYDVNDEWIGYIDSRSTQLIED